VEPLVAVVAEGDRPLADGRPYLLNPER
jgi:hypothetical protein